MFRMNRPLAAVLATALLSMIAIAESPPEPYAETAMLRIVLMNRAGGLALDADILHVNENDCRVQLWRDSGGDNQRWDIYSLPDAPGYYKILNSASGLALAAHLPDVNENDCRIQLWEYGGFDNQQWELIEVARNRYKIANRASGKLLSAHLFDVRRNGCRTQLWDDVNQSNQIWTVTAGVQR